MNDDELTTAVDFVVGEPTGGPPVATATDGWSRGADGTAHDSADADERVPRRPTRATRWGRRALAAVAVAAVVIAVAVAHARAVRHAQATRSAHSVATPAPSPSSSSSSSSSSSPSPREFNVGIVATPYLPSMPPCPSAGDAESACNTLRAVPARFVAAVHALFPLARRRSVLSVEVRDSPPMSKPGVWSRRYVARDGHVTLTVTVLALALDHSVVGVDDNGSRTRVFSERSSGGKLVLVEAVGPSGHAPSLDRVDALARDPRLLAV